MGIQVNELRIGNYVKSIGIVYQVLSIDFKGNIKGIEGNTSFNLDESTEPIPLTKEWLMKFGFEKSGHLIYKSIGSQNSITYNSCFGNIFINHPQGIISVKHEYVHQLQNLHYALTGEELIIKNQ